MLQVEWLGPFVQLVQKYSTEALGSHCHVEKTISS